MRKDAENRLLELGFDTDLIAKVESKSLTLSSLKPLNNAALLKLGFTNDEADEIISKVKREPIPKDVLDEILKKSGEVCCYCADGNTTRPFHIHHIDEYHKSRDNSEDNLALVCPNDHANVHLKKITIDEQKAIKKAWENLWAIAEEYKAKGFNFPFGAFEIIDYSVKGSITDVFSFASPNGSVCLELAAGHLASHCLKTLQSENKLILVGGSGSGKTTLAKGIAGHFKNSIVFKYVVSDKSSVEIAKEITQFLSLAQKELILIIDDANTKLKTEQIETVLKFANGKQKIILVNTRNTFISEGNLEQHFPNCVEHISWPALREVVVPLILENEAAVVDYLNEKDINDHNGHKIGYGVLDHKLNQVAESYAESTETVWQFIFMLGGGMLRTNKIYNELKAGDRFDLIVLYISIQQISKVEQGTSIDEIIELYKRNSTLKIHPAPDRDWLKNKLNELCDKRILVESRGRYKTVHREFAKSFIETSYFVNRSGSSELLDEVFKNFSNAKEIMILWSWLSYGAANDYTKRWAASLTIEQWRELAHECAGYGLSILSILARHLHTTTLPGHSKIAKEVFKDKDEIIAELINKGEEGTLYYFNEMGATLQYHCKEVIKPLLSKVDQAKFADLIKNSEIETFNYLNWLFNTIAVGDVQWILDLSKKITFSDFRKILERNEKGRIYLVYDLVEFYRRYIGNLKRSEFKYLVGMIGLQIKRCELEEIQFPQMYFSGLLELVYYPDDIKHILDSIDTDKITTGFEKATPRYWGAMLSFSQLSEYTDSTFSKDFVDGLNIDKVIENIERYYEGNLHEFRIIMYQLAYGSEKKRKEFAQRLQPLVEKAMVRFTDEKDHEDVLKAFYNLDESLGEETCKKLKKLIPRKREKINHEKELQEIKLEIEKQERSGYDYDLYDLKIKLK